MRLILLVPVYNDWTALSALLEDLNRELFKVNRRASVLIVDDGSPTSFQESAFDHIRPKGITSVEILRLRRNVGHQRAIAIGLAHLEANWNGDAVVIMDGDGEDRPEDVHRLVSALEQQDADRIVFAERTRRSEGKTFAVLYWLYRMIHLALTGERVRVGNFSVVPRSFLHRLVAISDVWNHFAAAVFHAKIPYRTVPTVRGRRYAGQSHMNLVALITHGLSAMSVFGDRIGVRMLLATCAWTAVTVAAAAATAGWHLVTGTPLPTWYPYAGVALMMFVFLAFTTSLTFVFIILSGRSNLGFLPHREYVHYVSQVDSIRLTYLHVKQPLHRH